MPLNLYRCFYPVQMPLILYRILEGTHPSQTLLDANAETR